MRSIDVLGALALAGDLSMGLHRVGKPDRRGGARRRYRRAQRLGAAMPGLLWRNPVSLALIGQTARLTLRAGNVSLQGHVPNCQWFQASPRRVRLVKESRAILHGTDLGGPAPLPTQTRLGDLWLPQQGIFFVGEAHLESLNPARHFVMAAPASGAVGRAFGQATGVASE